ncbi:Major Facilitator Superfamily protein [Pseudoalteromonas sp. P1-9]|uniref:MFS transporter n=1 Tax=Pseudoalteromonas sp. P1-9 TaxID=1710354 RepID=UPI0006D61575|nr:MFS transporter [Pseudoalteromonas sp. P1-9]KPV95306.1 Major Facilitator Superfamily protein [Pseudoalteromonas sp. P1-9]
MTTPVQDKPTLSFWQIWNMCFGFMGIQFGFALQNGNVSRIFQTLGANIDEIPILWIAAPLTGLIVQPIVGYFSDRTWGKLGRRRPFFLYGALATTLALCIMPNSSTLWIAAGMLWIMDAAINVTMEPFRALVGDNLPKKQRGMGYAMQSFFIGVGAVVASALPWMMTNWFGISNTAEAGVIPESVTFSFYFGAVVLLIAVLWTIVTTKEYSPEELAKYEDPQVTLAYSNQGHLPFARIGVALLGLGLLVLAAVYVLSLGKDIVFLGGALSVFGGLFLLSNSMQTRGKTQNGFYTVMSDMMSMPSTMKQLAVVQFFSWFALFAMWIYTTPAVTSFHFGSSDVATKAYNDGADWVGVLFAAYNGFSVIAAIVIPLMVKKLGLKVSHMINLLLGAGGMLSFAFISNSDHLIYAMVAIGFVWASVLSLPYAMLSNALPSNKMGVYMGIFNFFIVIPQMLAATILGALVRFVFDGEAIYALSLGGVSYLIAAIAVTRVTYNK